MGYYYLENGEIIQVGDEVEMSNGFNDDEVWQKTTCVGERAPDPKYPAHRVYRRRVEKST